MSSRLQLADRREYNLIRAGFRVLENTKIIFRVSSHSRKNIINLQFTDKRIWWTSFTTQNNFTSKFPNSALGAIKTRTEAITNCQYLQIHSFIIFEFLYCSRFSIYCPSSTATVKFPWGTRLYYCSIAQIDFQDNSCRHTQNPLENKTGSFKHF